MPGRSPTTSKPRPWSLEGLLAHGLISQQEYEVARSRVVHPARPKVCPSCGSANRPSKRRCSVCGAELTAPPASERTGSAPAEAGEGAEPEGEPSEEAGDPGEPVDVEMLLHHPGPKHPGPVGAGGQMVGVGGMHLLTRLYPAVFDIRIALAGTRVVLEWEAPEYDPRQVKLLGYEVTREEQLPHMAGSTRRWVGYTRPEERTFSVVHRSGAHSYDVTPVYRNLRTGEIVWGG
ncbi:MAG TPA: hypothetical protein VNO34_02835 [Actinomycetota bacterium]|nr:hypothetical protein [Actinomycetota bacterium]